jgi:uncharacterized protein (TIGR02391 family)
MNKRELIQEILMFRDEVETFRQLLLDSRDSMMPDIVRNHEDISKQRSALVRKRARLSHFISKFGKNPRMRDGVNPEYYQVYDNAFSTDILIRVGPSIEAVIQDLDHIIGSLEGMRNEEFEKEDIKNNTKLDKLEHIHPIIVKKCRNLYEAEQYPEAVEKSFKIIKDKLRDLTSFESGSDAFGKGKLHIKGAAAQNVDADFNNGVKFLTMAIDMFRNEKSHTSDGNIEDPIRAYQYLAMSSLALSLIENSEIRN